MSWSEVVERWAGQGHYDWLFETVTYLPPAEAEAALKALKDSPFRPPAALKTWTVERLRPWARSPWRRLAESGAAAALLAGLESDYAEVALALTPADVGLLFHHAPENPAVQQLVAETGWQAGAGESGWEESRLLSGQPLEPHQLGRLLLDPDWRARAGAQLAHLPFPQALVLLLESGGQEWEWLPAPQTSEQQTLLELAQGWPELRPLVQAAAGDDPEAVIQLWERTRLPVLRQWWTQHGWTSIPLTLLATGGSLEGCSTGELLAAAEDVDEELAGRARVALASRGDLEQARRERPTPAEARQAELNRAWRTLRQAPLEESSRSLRALTRQGFLPREEWSLYHRLARLVEKGELRLPRPQWRTLPLEDKATKLFLHGHRLAVAHGPCLSLWSLPEGQLEARWKPDVDPKECQAFFLESGLLLREGQKLSLWTYQGEHRWSRSTPRGPVACWGHQLALGSPGGIPGRTDGIQLISLDDGQDCRTGASGVAPTPVPRGPIFVGGTPPQCLAWSADGRHLATSQANIVVVWEAESLEPVRRVESVGAVTWLGFVGPYLVSGSEDRLGSTILLGWDQTVSLWDPLTGQEVHRCHDLGPVRQVLQDGTRLALRCPEAVFCLDCRDGRAEVTGRLPLLEGRLLDLCGSVLAVHHRGKCLLADHARGEVIASWEGVSDLRLYAEGAVALRGGQVEWGRLWDPTPIAELRPEQLRGLQGAPRQYLEALGL